MALRGLHHIHLRARDLEGSRAFARDFGLIEAGAGDGRVYLRGTGTAAYHLILEQAESSSLAGIAFEADGEQDLEAAVRDHNASAIRALDGPGGGKAVSLQDPEGNEVHIVTGVAEREADALHPGRIHNHGLERPRRGTVAGRGPVWAAAAYPSGTYRDVCSRHGRLRSLVS